MGKQVLLDVKKSFTLHLRKEDEGLYPLLDKGSQNDPQLKTIIEVFAAEMKQATKQVQKFFDMLETSTDEKKLASAFSDLCQALLKRIKSEEGILYEEYEKLKTPGVF